MTWTEVTPQPAVGDKITAAGFGLQVYTMSNEVQDAIDTISGGTAATGASSFAATRDALIASDWTKPGADVQGITRSGPTTVTAGAGATTVIAAPGSGARVIKSVLIHVPTAGSTVTLTLATRTIGYLNFTLPGAADIDCAIPMTSSDTGGLKVTATTGDVYVTGSYADRTDSLVSRFGLTNGSTSGTLISSGTARTITSLWIANASASSSATATVNVGGAAMLNAITVPAYGLLILDMNVKITNSEAVTWAGDSATALTYMAVGH